MQSPNNSSPPAAPSASWFSRLFILAPLSFWLLFAALMGGLFGVGGYTFIYAEGGSYFSDDPLSCINCHIMEEQYEGWGHGSHKHVATCNDCHTPHTFPEKYIVKGINGWNHSVAFTTNNFHEPIQINNMNRTVALDNCIYCHGEFVSPITSIVQHDEQTNCLACHQDVGH